MKRPSKELVKKWYGKLAKTGFDDIERGKDMNQYPATTMPGRHRSMHLEYPADLESFDDGSEQDIEQETNSIVNDSKAVYWRRVRDQVNRLGADTSPGIKQFLLDWVESGNLTETARDYGWTRMQAYWVAKQFMVQAGLRMGIGRAEDSGEPEPEPAPVRILTKTEIKRLRYKCPKDIKDSTDE